MYFQTLGTVVVKFLFWPISVASSSPSAEETDRRCWAGRAGPVAGQQLRALRQAQEWLRFTTGPGPFQGPGCLFSSSSVFAEEKVRMKGRTNCQLFLQLLFFHSKSHMLQNQPLIPDSWIHHWTFKRQLYRVVLGSQKNWGEGTDISHHLLPPHAQLPPLSTSPCRVVHLLQLMNLHWYSITTSSP